MPSIYTMNHPPTTRDFQTSSIPLYEVIETSLEEFYFYLDSLEFFS